MGNVRVLLTVNRDATADVANRLRAAGVQVTNEMSSIGVVSAVADEQAVANLRSVPGVLDVEHDQSLRIAPPESPVQ